MATEVGEVVGGVVGVELEGGLVVGAVRNGGEGKSWWWWLGLVDATDGCSGGGEGDVDAEIYEAIGELKGRVYVAKGRERYEEEMVISHLLIKIYLFFFFLEQ